MHIDKRDQSVWCKGEKISVKLQSLQHAPEQLWNTSTMHYVILPLGAKQNSYQPNLCIWIICCRDVSCQENIEQLDYYCNKYNGSSWLPFSTTFAARLTQFPPISQQWSWLIGTTNFWIIWFVGRGCHNFCPTCPILCGAAYLTADVNQFHMAKKCGLEATRGRNSHTSLHTAPYPRHIRLFIVKPKLKCFSVKNILDEALIIK